MAGPPRRGHPAACLALADRPCRAGQRTQRCPPLPYILRSRSMPGMVLQCRVFLCLPCVTGVCARRCHVLAMRLVQSSCRLAGRFFKYSGPSRSGTCPVPDGIAGWRAAHAGCPLHGSRSCPAGRLLPTLFLAAGGNGRGVEPPLACAGAAKRPRTEVPGTTPGTRRYALSSASSA